MLFDRLRYLLSAAVLVMMAACAPGPPPTPTVPPQLDRTVTPTLPTATGSPTDTTTPTLDASATIPSKTPTLVPSFTAQPTRTPLAAALASPTSNALPTIPPPSAPAPTQPPVITSAPAVNPAPGVGIPVGVPTAVAANPDRPVVSNPASSANGSPGSYRPVYVSGQSNPLPVPASVNPSTLPTVPQNMDFDNGAHEQGAQEVRVPQDWTAWWRTGVVDCQLYSALPTDGPCPAVEHPGVQYRRPEFTVIYSTDPAFNNPPRVYGQGWAARFFCTFGICIGGYMQRVRVTPGQSYILSAMVQSWCNTETDRSHSDIATRDGRLNCELALGLDPTGGADPFSASIVWQAINAYDTYTLLATPPVTAQGQVMTLYLRGRSLWGFLHNDFHFDQVRFSPG